MPIIFQPDPGLFELRKLLGAGLEKALVYSALDFLARDNKPFAYYVGVATGGTALATGIPNAVATIYVVGQTLDFYVLKSPEGSNIDVFLDGVAATTISTYAVNNVWESVQISFAEGTQKRVDFVNAGPAAGNVSGISWMALGGPFVLGGTAPAISEVERLQLVATTVSIKFQDAAGTVTSEAILFPDTFTLANIQAWLTSALPDFDTASGAEIIGVGITLSFDYSGLGLKATPAAGSRVSTGALLGFRATDGSPDTIFLPSLVDSLVSGGNVSVSGAIANIRDKAALVGVDDAGTPVYLGNRVSSPYNEFRYVKLRDRDKI